MVLKFKQYRNLLESISISAPIIIIDIQPAYESYCNNVICDESFIEMVNSQQNILWFFNGDSDGITEDNLSTVKQWLLDYGVSKTAIKRIKFREKTYGFFRGWMDNSVPDNIIIKVIREMYMTRKYSSEDLDLSKILTPSELEMLPQSDVLYLTNIAITELKQYAGFICGGGKHECLREIELLMNAFNFKCKRLQNYIY